MSFEDLFVESYGDNATEYLKKEYAVSLNNGRNAFADYVVETKNGNFAIEENGVHYHHPCLIGNVAYEKQFAYSAHTACDKKGFVLDHIVTPANKHDSTVFSDVYQRLKRFKIEYIGLDAGYKTPAIAKEIIDDNKIPLMPYTRPKNKNYDFEYNAYYDYYTCPNGNILEQQQRID